MSLTGRIIDADGPVHVTDYGGAGSAIVLLHGATSCAASWQGLAERLTTRHRVIAPDFIGHGRTPRAGRKATLTADRVVLERTLDAFDLETAAFVSVTRGGLVSCLQAKAMPTRVTALVLVEPATLGGGRMPGGGMLAAGALATVPALANRVLCSKLKVNQGAAAAVREWLPMAARHPEVIEPSTIEALGEAMAARLGEAQPFAGWAHAFRNIGAMALRGQLDSAYDGLPLPALVIVGRDATSATPAAVSRLVARHPGWRSEVLDGVGHAAMEAPDQTAELIERHLAPQL
jgi:pimeloyl-ACP methyl ester carboxylesterase